MGFLWGAKHRGRDRAATEARLPAGYAIPVIAVLSVVAWAIVIVVSAAVWHAL